MRLPINISDFKTLVKGRYLYVDKTLFIKEIIMDNEADIILLNYPSCFGKTVNLSMLYYFLSHDYTGNKNENLYEGLSISKDIRFCKEHQQQYPVIFISFKDIKQPSFAGACDDFVKLIKSLYSQHRYLLEEDLLHRDEKEVFIALLKKKANFEDLKDAIKQLSMYLMRKFDRAPVILIDEYDTPMQEAFGRNYYEEIFDLMQDILSRTLKDNRYIGKTVITGTNDRHEGLFSELNNIEICSLFQEKFTQYFGFTEEEVSKILVQGKQGFLLSSIKDRCNCYQASEHVLYDPSFIINYLDSNGKYKFHQNNK